jgi:outer membrane protein OmpA-like peptidoglycan-associated protein
MSSRLPIGLLGATALALATIPVQAAQQLPAGWYVQGGAGGNFLSDADIEVGGIEREAEHDIGWLGTGSVGYAWQNGLRLELEGAYRSNGIDTIAGAAGTGDVTSTNIMANLIYQYQTTGWVVPYLGFGIGAGHVSLDSVGPVGGPPTTTVDDSDWAMAYQVLVGLEHAITDNLGLNLAYRFLYQPDVSLTAANGAGVDTKYLSHAVMVGLRWSFGAPKPVMGADPPRPAPPMAQPAPAPAPPPMAQQAPSQYLVFFDWDSAVLTTEAQNIVRTAAQAARQGRVARIEVTGHADRSGPDRYNVRLSQRRAQAVQAELVKNGVSASDIAIFAKGESDPLVPTADGVREPQNRRVQIVFPGQGRPGT